MTNTRKLQLALHLLAGGALIAFACVADDLLSEPRHFGTWQKLVLAAGIGVSLWGVARPGGDRLARLSSGLCVSLLSLLLFLSAAELLFRALDHDFGREEHAWRRIPPYYRQPTIPVGEAFFRRPGPERWTGRVLSAELERLGIVPNPYADDEPITVEYDRHGFRNPDDLTDWRIAVAGDSFTELGYLPHEQLFTTALSRKLGQPVRNLGTSFTGPLTQLCYLREFGVAPSLRHAVIVFFEGNDLPGLAFEDEALRRWQTEGVRETREFRRQSSLLKAIATGLRQALRRPPSSSSLLTATFESASGPEPVTLQYTPPSRAELSDETRRQLRDFFRGFEEFGRERRVVTWLAYMPCKRRVLDGLVRFAPDAEERLREWRPSDLPEVIRELCDEHGVRMIDLTPRLRDETVRTRTLLYNTIYDTHLNARGSEIVGEEMAEVMAAAEEGSR